MLDGTHYFDCVCESDEHLLKFILSKDPEEPEIYISIFLQKYGFFRRVWVAIKYIFGHKSKYGHWDNWIMKPEDAQRLKDMIDEFLEIKNNENK